MPPRRPGRRVRPARRTLLAAALVALLALSGCTTIRDAVRPRQQQPGPSASSAALPAVPQGLERFYGQKLDWNECGKAQCAWMTVPQDYAEPSGATIRIAILRMPATSRGKRIGALVVNPGGPGGSGVDYAGAADFIVGQPVRARFDIVGFDPRGVGRSAPIDCLSDHQLDGFLGFDPTPDTPAEEQAFADNAKTFADRCRANAGPLLGHVSTVDAAKDMDVLRHLLGEPRLHYLGKSYGTFLGATYADLFPRNVGRFVLDGVVAPDLTSEEVNLGQAAGFERATRAWARSCIDEGGCPLGTTVDGVMRGLRDFLRQVDANPIPRTGDSAVTRLTEGWASTGIAAAMYDQGQWSTLTDALRDAKKGDGSSLMGLANTYADRKPGGGYSGNIMEVIYAVNCLDKTDSPDLAVHEQQAKASLAKAPTWGPFLMWSSMPCGFWPDRADAPGSGPRKISAQGSGPIVVVGTTRDPATPYEWSVRLREQLSNASLITFDGDGHTAYTRSNSCVDGAINDYYVAGTVPKDGLKC